MTKLFAAIAFAAMGSQAALAETAADTFTATVTLANGLTVACNAGQLNFGTVTRPSNYTGGGTVTISAESGATPSPSTAEFVVNGGGVLTCGVTGASNNLSVVFTGSGVTGGTTLTLNGTGDVSGKTLTVVLYSAFTDGSSPEGGTTDLFIGGTLTVDSATDAPAGTYTSDTVTVTITDAT